MINLPSTSPCTKPKAHSTSHPSVLAWKPWQSTFNYTSNWLWKKFIAGAWLNGVIGVGADGKGGKRSWFGGICDPPLQKKYRTGGGACVPKTWMVVGLGSQEQFTYFVCCHPSLLIYGWDTLPATHVVHQLGTGDMAVIRERSMRGSSFRALICLQRAYQKAYQLSSSEAARVRVPFLT